MELLYLDSFLGNFRLLKNITIPVINTKLTLNGDPGNGYPTCLVRGFEYPNKICIKQCQSLQGKKMFTFCITHFSSPIPY